MNYTYDKPLVIHMGPKRLSVDKVKHGVTEVSLSDGRSVRITLHIEGVRDNGSQLDLDYSAIVEVMPEDTGFISDVHEVVQ